MKDTIVKDKVTLTLTKDDVGIIMSSLWKTSCHLDHPNENNYPGFLTLRDRFIELARKMHVH